MLWWTINAGELGWDAVNHPSPYQSSYGHIVEGIQAELRTIHMVSFNYVAREANNDAHVLTKLATTHVIDSTWVEETY
jgi:hypothetical protein